MYINNCSQLLQDKINVTEFKMNKKTEHNRKSNTQIDF